MPSVSRNVLLSGFMTELSQVDGFPCSYEDLLRFAEQIPKESGFKPTKSRGGVRAKTVYNHWCGTQWKEYCIKEYGKSLPLADVKDKESGEVKIDAHTKLRQEMYAAFQETEDYEILKKQVEEENKKLGKSTPVKRKPTKAQQIEELRKELEEVRRKILNQMNLLKNKMSNQKKITLMKKRKKSKRKKSKMNLIKWIQMAMVW